jgi:hypothetical protein
MEIPVSFTFIVSTQQSNNLLSLSGMYGSNEHVCFVCRVLSGRRHIVFCEGQMAGLIDYVTSAALARRAPLAG